MDEAKAAFIEASKWPWQEGQPKDRAQLLGILAYFLDEKQLRDNRLADYQTLALKRHFLDRTRVVNRKNQPFDVSQVLLQKFFWYHLPVDTLEAIFNAYDDTIGQEWEGRWWFMAVYLPTDPPSDLLERFLEEPNRDWIPFDRVDGILLERAQHYQGFLDQLFPATLVPPKGAQSVCMICKEDIDQDSYCSSACCDPTNQLVCCRADFEEEVKNVTSDVYRSLYTGVKWSGPVSGAFVTCKVCGSLASAIKTRSSVSLTTLDVREALQQSTLPLKRKEPPEQPPATVIKRARPPPPSQEDVKKARRRSLILAGEI